MSAETDTARTDAKTDADVVIIGAGFSGLYLTKRLQEEGVSVRVIEAGSDVGGTWFWNRYPGARCDSDSQVYCYSTKFDDELARTWRWSERYPAQKELLTYFHHVADKFGLRDSITFNTRVESAVFDKDSGTWTLTTDSGDTVTARYFIPAVGALTKPNIPNIAGKDDFRGEIYHTSRMPDDFDATGKRIAIIGSGATAVQLVPETAKTAAHVYAMQRNPSHCLPGRNHPLGEDDYQEISTHTDAIWEQARGNFGGFPYKEFAGDAGEFAPEQQREILEKAWQLGGLPMAYSTFADLITDRVTNQMVLDFFGDKIRALVRDPETAEALVPTDPFVSKRPRSNTATTPPSTGTTSTWSTSAATRSTPLSPKGFG